MDDEIVYLRDLREDDTGEEVENDATLGRCHPRSIMDPARMMRANM